MNFPRAKQRKGSAPIHLYVGTLCPLNAWKGRVDWSWKDIETRGIYLNSSSSGGAPQEVPSYSDEMGNAFKIGSLVYLVKYTNCM